MKMYRLVVLSLGLCGAVLSASAQEAFRPLPVTESRNAAVGYALTQAAIVATLVRSCKKVDEPLNVDPDVALSSWLGRNRQHVEASQGWILYVKSLVASRQGREAADAFQRNTLADFSASADKTVKDIFAKSETKKVACDKWMEYLSNPQLDLSASGEFGRDLDDILSFHKAVMERASRR